MCLDFEVYVNLFLAIEMASLNRNLAFSVVDLIPWLLIYGKV